MRVVLGVLAIVATVHAIVSPIGINWTNTHKIYDKGPPLTKLDENEYLKLSEECGIRAYNLVGNKIAGGFRSEIGQFPWSVAIISQDASDKQTVYCSGTLITGRHVLTAAHCIYNKDRDVLNDGQYYVGVGGTCSFMEGICNDADFYSITKHRKIVRVSAYRVFEEYFNKQCEYGNGDLAILELENEVWPIVEDDDKENGSEIRIRPACLPSSSSTVKELNEKNDFYGNGFGEDETDATSPFLRYVQTIMVDRSSDETPDDNAKKYGRDCIYTEIKAQKQKEKAKKNIFRKGDHGSGLLAHNHDEDKWTVRGVLSGGEEFVCNTNVEKYIKEISELIGISGTSVTSAATTATTIKPDPENNGLLNTYIM